MDLRSTSIGSIRMAAKRAPKLTASAMLAGCVVIVYYAVVAAFCPNGPYFDDFFSILEPVVNLARRPGVSDWIAVLISQNNQHRVITTHLSAVASWMLLGHVSFWGLNLFGNLLLLLAAGSIKASIDAPDNARHLGRSAAASVLIIACLLFNFSFFRLLSFPMAAVSNVGVYAFAILGFWALFSGRTWAGFAALLASAASQANGLIGLPLATVFLLRQRDWRRAAWAAVSSAIVIGLYFRHYDLHATMSPMLSPPADASLGAHTSIPLRVVYLFVQIGSLAMLNNRAMHLPVAFVAIPFFTGIGLVWVHYRLVREGALAERPALAAFMLFLLAAFLAITVVRVSASVDDWVPVRYKLISCLYACSVVALSAAQFTQRHPGRVSLSGVLAGCAMLYWLTSLIYLPVHVAHYRQYVAPLVTEAWYTQQQSDAARQILDEAQTMDIFRWRQRID
ncbi:conserved membrane protein of unknown function [Paraburkholderia dioscoreae]|uniref:Transmembrane protein n=3 Tax=Paraburkholderia TaxID=1822464 RepID=A0A5Q4YWU4_9BURK|nr:conserved membrane protein of unknown function [Paraburkholderia dioscoreae]